MAEQMRNKTFHRRLFAIEAKFDRAAKAIEWEHMSIAESEVSDERAERAYRKIIKPPRDTLAEGTCKLMVQQAAAEYFRLIRAPLGGR